LYGNCLTGPIPDFSVCSHLQVIDLRDNNLTGAIPDFSACTQLEKITLSENNLTGALPAPWPASLRLLDVCLNPDLAGFLTADLVLQSEKPNYTGCKARWDKALGKKNDDWMQGPFIEEIATLLRSRKKLNITDDMLNNPPGKGDTRYKMYVTHGGD